MIENHLFQIVALLAMEPPTYQGFDAVQTEKVKVFRLPCAHYDPMILSADSMLVIGMNRAWQRIPMLRRSALYIFVSTDGVGKESRYWRSGKYLAETANEVLVELKPPPQKLFDDSPGATEQTNYLRFQLSPHSTIGLAARVKRKGKKFIGEQKELYVIEEEPGEQSPYERLLGDAISGDRSLFTRQDAVEFAWAVIDPVL